MIVPPFVKVLAVLTTTPAKRPHCDTISLIIVFADADQVQIIALKAGGAGPEMDEVALRTSGSVQTTTTDSSNIVGAILAVGTGLWVA